MQVSEFPIGRGEVYIRKDSPVRKFVEVISVTQCGRHLRWVHVADHVKGKRVPWTSRIVFGAESFLAQYRPATAEDCRPRSLAACPSSRAIRRVSVSSSRRTSAPGR